MFAAITILPAKFTKLLQNAKYSNKQCVVVSSNNFRWNAVYTIIGNSNLMRIKLNIKI